MYVTVNKLHRTAQLNAGKDESEPPYYIIRFRPLGPASSGGESGPPLDRSAPVMGKEAQGVLPQRYATPSCRHNHLRRGGRPLPTGAAGGAHRNLRAWLGKGRPGPPLVLHGFPASNRFEGSWEPLITQTGDVLTCQRARWFSPAIKTSSRSPNMYKLGFLAYSQCTYDAHISKRCLYLRKLLCPPMTV